MGASILTAAAGCEQQPAASTQNLKLRPAGAAGVFYPADPAELTAMMDKMLPQASTQTVDGQIVAVVAPHAGYEYSGPVAAYTYAALKGHRYARVVVIAPSHYEAFDFASVYDGDGYVTPLGTVPVDKIFARELAKMSTSIQLSERGHKATRHGAEHAIEVQLPWLQHVLGSFTLVPVVMGDQSYQSSRALGIALEKLIREEHLRNKENPGQAAGDTLIVASSDLSHYHTYAEAEKIDHKTLSALEAWDYLNMSRNFETRIWEACGGAPIVAAMIAAERLGANRAQVLDYANSGDVTGDRTRVVGYSADIFVQAQDGKPIEPLFSLNEHEEETLLSLAHKSVERAVLDRKLYEPSTTNDAMLDQERGVFVTLREAGRLRGCIGYVSAVKPLYEAVRDTAALAAIRDPRFHPVAADELSQLEYEISVLSPLQHVLDVKEIDVGRHGLLIKNGDHEGLLLPQVAVEQHWDRNRFLQETCKKSGLSPDCWMDSDTDIFCFTALAFREHKQPHAD
ncbi:MAG TPA: AmmeMemoRadiSam system protein B [Terracidiphilus sp.]|nr:AmmeMemoRadiSam system protein B [Terracidiphilus sp.]